MDMGDDCMTKDQLIEHLNKLVVCGDPNNYSSVRVETCDNGKFLVELVMSTFEGMDDVDRQQKLWEHILKKFPSDECASSIDFIFSYTREDKIDTDQFVSLLRKSIGGTIKGIGYLIDNRRKLVKGILIAGDRSSQSYNKLIGIESELEEKFGKAFDFDFRMKLMTNTDKLEDIIPPSYTLIDGEDEGTDVPVPVPIPVPISVSVSECPDHCVCSVCKTIPHSIIHNANDSLSDALDKLGTVLEKLEDSLVIRFDKPEIPNAAYNSVQESALIRTMAKTLAAISMVIIEDVKKRHG